MILEARGNVLYSGAKEGAEKVALETKTYPRG
jgi:hypothetical protein